LPIERYTISLAGGGTAHIVATGKADGDFHIDGPPSVLAERRARVVDRPWFWLRQVHGATVVDAVEVDDVGAAADAVVSRSTDLALAVHTADCVPIALVAPDEGWIGAVHAGWRGLVDGVIDAAIGRLRAHGATRIVGIVGPCISPDAYEFGAADLASVVGRYGPSVAAHTAAGAPALDLRAAVRCALDEGDVELAAMSDRSTATDAADLYSHRARGEAGRQALVVWIESAAKVADRESA
jgi:polyphenol oxidase